MRQTRYDVMMLSVTTLPVQTAVMSHRDGQQRYLVDDTAPASLLLGKPANRSSSSMALSSSSPGTTSSASATRIKVRMVTLWAPRSIRLT
jgi:hypothetical protein